MDTEKAILLGKNIHRLDICIGRKLLQNDLGALPPEVSGGNGRIIHFLLENEGKDIFQKDLEKEFGITPSTASRVIVLMEQKGLVERLPVPSDARLKKLCATSKARAIAERMNENFARINQQLLQGFTPEETGLLMSFISRMQQNLDNQRSKEKP